MNKEPWWKTSDLMPRITAAIQKIKPLRYISQEEADNITRLLDECRGTIAGYRLADKTPRTEQLLKYHLAHLLSVASTIPGIKVSEDRSQDVHGVPITTIEIKWSKP